MQLPIRFSIPHQEQGPDGQVIAHKNIILDAYYIEQTQAIQEEMQLA